MYDLYLWHKLESLFVYPTYCNIKIIVWNIIFPFISLKMRSLFALSTYKDRLHAMYYVLKKYKHIIILRPEGFILIIKIVCDNLIGWYYNNLVDLVVIRDKAIFSKINLCFSSGIRLPSAASSLNEWFFHGDVSRCTLVIALLIVL